MSADPWLAVLLDQYTATLGRLQRSFVGPERIEQPRPMPVGDFAAAYRDGTGGSTASEFLALQQRTREATGLPPAPDEDAEAQYGRYSEWLSFATRAETVLARVAQRLGYDTEQWGRSGPKAVA
jgi:hypothetical protein